MTGYQVGDYVIADHAEYDDFTGETYEIVAIDYNLLGQRLVHVIDITTRNKIQPRRLCFFPRELSWEDGTRP